MTISNKYQIEQKYISFGNSRSGEKISKIRFIVSHETANNNADADDHFNYFNKNAVSASAHTFIDDKKVLEIIPLYKKAWYVNYEKVIDNQLFGDDANDAAIGVELIKPDPLPVKAPEMIRLAKLIDTTNPELMKKLKAEGYIVLDV